EGAGPEKSKELLQEHRIEKLLVVDKARALKGLITIKDIEKTARYPNATKDSRGSLRVGAALGTGKDFEERLDAFVEAGVDVVFLDTAHGHSRRVLTTTLTVKKKYPDLKLIVGNVATGEAVKALIDSG